MKPNEHDQLDELKAAWMRLESRVDAAEAMALDSWSRPRIEHSRSAVRRFGGWQVAELVAWIVFTAFAATFWVEHRETPHLLAAGLSLHAYGIAAIWAAATRALLAARVHSGDSVVVMQRRLAQLRRFATISTVALVLPWWCLWWVATLVGVQWWIGLDLYAAAPAWTHANLAFGLLAIGASSWLARRWARTPPRAAWLRRIIDDIAGRNLRRARQQLEEVEQFNRP